ncbi:integrase core domain-containing protein [Yoonia sp. MH D7]
MALQFACRTTVGAKAALIAPGSPWENGYCGSFSSRLGDELLNGEVFCTFRSDNIRLLRYLDGQVISLRDGLAFNHAVN